jgi:REP element-mobilizing transposase RayT
MYHLVFPAKYRRKILTERVKRILKAVCLGIEKRYQIRFLEIGMEENHVHFLVQSVPMYSPTKIVRAIKSITAKRIFLMCPVVKDALWGGEFWTKGYFVNTVSKHGNESVISEYVKGQGKGKYEELYRQQELFE